MASPRNYQGTDFKPQMRTSNIQTYKPGEFIKNFQDRRDSMGSFTLPSTIISQGNILKNSIVGGSIHSDQFYKSQVIQRGIGGQPVYLNAINHYKPLSGTDDPAIMDQIRNQHLKIMDNKLQEAITVNGGNAMQQVKTIIVQPIAEVVQLNVSTVQDNYQARTSNILNTTGFGPYSSNRVSTISYSPLNSPRNQYRTSQINNHSRVQYVPYERKVIQLQTRQVIERVPVEKRIIQYQDRIRKEQVPVQKSIVDYYAVQHITQYEPQIVEKKVIQMVPVEKTIQTTNYIPVEQKIIHYPENGALRGSIISYQQPIVQRNNALRGSIIYQSPTLARSNSVLSHGAIISPQKRIIRNSSQLINLQSVTSISNNHQNNINNKGFQFTRLVEQPVTYVHNARVLPQRIVHQPIIHRNQHIRYPTNIYPAPSHVQTIYQIPTQPVNIVNHVSPDRFTFSQPREIIYDNTIRSGSIHRY